VCLLAADKASLTYQLDQLAHDLAECAEIGDSLSNNMSTDMTSLVSLGYRVPPNGCDASWLK